MNRRIERPKSTFDFLEQEVYLPEYMLLTSADYDKNGGIFTFKINEPKVAQESTRPNYVTPRGLDLCIAQAGYALVENMVNEKSFGETSLEELRKTFLEGKVRIIEIYEKFRRELMLKDSVQGRFNISRLRLGKIPILKLDFDFANNSISGNFTSIVTSLPNPPLNAYAARNKL